MCKADVSTKDEGDMKCRRVDQWNNNLERCVIGRDKQKGGRSCSGGKPGEEWVVRTQRETGPGRWWRSKHCCHHFDPVMDGRRAKGRDAFEEANATSLRGYHPVP